ncbi:MAG: EAL domain-containing protein [Gemmatimonadota bacterium]
MAQVIERLMMDHDLGLVLLAGAICVVGAIATMNLSVRVRGGRRKALRLVFVAFCAGATVWSTHFVAMLAYLTNVPMTYELGLTTLSFVAGTVLIGIGFGVAIHGQGGRSAGLLGGAILGAGVVVLHYVGMAAVRLPGILSYQPALAVVSVAVSLGLGSLALGGMFGRHPGGAKSVGILLMVGMILSLHFTAMGAANVVHGVALGGATNGISRAGLAIAVAVVSLLILAFGLAGAILDKKFSHRRATEADRFRTLADGAFEGLVVHRAGTILDANAAARHLFGPSDTLAGASVRGWFEETDQAGADRFLAGAGDETLEVELRGSEGTSFPAEVSRRRILASDGAEAELLAIRDLTSRKESEARIVHLALHDPLTDLPNRRFFLEMAEKAISEVYRTGDRVAFLTVGMDNFKAINDIHGHSAGDALLRATGERIRATLRDGDFCARMGGDEFAILQTRVTSVTETLALAGRLLDALRDPVRLPGGDVAASGSIGAAFFPEDGHRMDGLLRNALTAMHRAKADGKATLRFFEADMDAALVGRRILESGLGRALSEGRFFLEYQPIVESRGRKAVAFEALVRWRDPELGLVTPAEFVPIAEETGLIVPIGEFVVREAIRAAASWPESLRVAINLSAVQFRQRGLVAVVRQALEEYGVPGHRVELEVTETLLVENRQAAVRTLRELKGLGMRISMDDFGTGYSSLSYLQSFPFDKIKIDQSFVADLAQNDQNAAIVRAILALGKSLRMKVVAEGVETMQQADLLEDFGCDELQGFLLARPMAASEIASYLARQEPARPTLVAVSAA